MESTMKCLAVVAVASAVLVSGASAKPNLVIKGHYDIGGFDLTKDGSLKAALHVFGAPSSRVPIEATGCLVQWRQYGIAIKFTWLDSPAPCAKTEACHDQTMIRSRHWMTGKGLHVGDPVRKLRKLYPRATRYIPATDWVLLSRPFAGGPPADASGHCRQGPRRRLRGQESVAAVLLSGCGEPAL